MYTNVLLTKKVSIHLLIIICVGIIFCSPLFAQIGFTPSVRVNDITTGDQHPTGVRAVAVSQETVYVVWSDAVDFSDTSEIYFSKSIDGGVNYSPSIIVSSLTDTATQYKPSIFVDNNSIIYVVWQITDFSTWMHSFLAKSTDGGTSFMPAVLITDASGIGGIAVDGNNVYVSLVRGYPFQEFLFARSTNGGTSFEPAYQVNDAPSIDSMKHYPTPDICVDASGSIHMTWADGRFTGNQGDIFYARSTNNGVSFETNILISDTTGAIGDSMQYNARVATGSGNSVYVVWADERNGEYTYLARSTDNGQSFGSNILINDIGQENHATLPCVTTTSSNKVHIAYKGHNSNWGEGIFSRYTENGGQTFSEAFPVLDVPDMTDITFLSNTRSSYDYTAVVWDDSRTGDADIYSALGPFLTIAEQKSKNFESNYYSFPTFIRGPLSLPEDQHCQIYDISGRSIDHQLLDPGIYFIQINGRITQKIIKLE